MTPAGLPSIDRQAWERISSIFAEALEFPAAERDAFLAAACYDSEQIEMEVRQLHWASYSLCVGSPLLLALQKARRFKPPQPAWPKTTIRLPAYHQSQLAAFVFSMN